MTIAVTKTDAETQLARQFEAVAGQLPGGDWMPAARAKAIHAFGRSGLPHRRIEAWKYTDLRTGIKTAYPPARCAAHDLDEATLRAALGPELHGLRCLRFVLLNGRLVRSANREAESADVIAASLAGSLGQPGYEWIASCFDPERQTEDDPVVALNTAFVTDGLILRIAAGVQLELPIHIVSVVTAETASSIATRHLIRVEAGARAMIVESHVEIGREGSQANSVVQVSVAPGGEAHHIKHVAALPLSSHLARWDIELGEGATYRGFQLTAGAGLLRNETHVSFSGPDAKLDLSGLMLGRGADHIDTTMIINHTTTGCEGRELFKAVLDDRARAVFQGKVVVAPDAQKTDGKQMAQALMLSDDAEFDSKPELEIYADDVVCGHGATVAELDADMLFYLRSRGIGIDEARRLLIESFAAEALERIEDELVRETMRAIALDWLGRR